MLICINAKKVSSGERRGVPDQKNDETEKKKGKAKETNRERKLETIMKKEK